MKIAGAVLGFIILAAIFVVWIRAYKSIKGDSGRLFSGKPGDHKESLEAFVASYKRGEVPAVASTAATPLPAVAVAAAVVAQSAPVKREAFVSGATKLAYLACKAGLRDHHIFAHVPLSALATGGSIDATLVRSGIDLLICNSAMSAVAAIDVIDASNATTNAAKTDYLKVLGIRYLRLSAKSLPRPDELHALLYKM